MVLAAVIASVVVLAACSDDDPPATQQTCVPGASVACVGAGGCAGGQACKADGTGYAECVCGAAANDGGDVSTPDGGDASPPAVTPTLGGQHFTWTLKKGDQTLTCAAAGADSIAVTYTPTGSVDFTEKKLPCAPGEGTTLDLPFGSYKVNIAAVNAASQSLGESVSIDATFSSSPCDSVSGTSCIRSVTVTLPID